MRYLGCKTKLLQEIAELMKKKKLFDGNRTFFDAFSGTATVGNHFKDYFKILTINATTDIVVAIINVIQFQIFCFF